MISAYDYTKTLLTLVDGKTLKPLEMGQTIESFRGEKYILVGGTPPHKPAAQGYILVVEVGMDPIETSPLQYYANVFNAAWVAEPKLDDIAVSRT